MSGTCRATAALSLALALPACADFDPGEPALPNNQAPIAGLRAPVIAPVGLPATFDASASFDPDGDPLTYAFSFGDAPPLVSAEPVVQHVFEADGLYTVLVRVMDLRGGRAAAQQDVSVREEYPEPPSFCAAPEDCVVGDECDAGVCYTTGGAIE